MVPSEALLALQRLASTACWRGGLMLALLAMARCAVVCGVVTTKAGNMLSGERRDLRKDPCGRWKVQLSRCKCRHSKLKDIRMDRMVFFGHNCFMLEAMAQHSWLNGVTSWTDMMKFAQLGFGTQVFVENCLLLFSLSFVTGCIMV